MERELAVVVRRATTTDASAMRDIQLDCLEKIFPPFYTETVLTTWTSLLSTNVYKAKVQSSGWCYVAVVSTDGGERVVGYGFMNTNSRRPQLVPEKHACQLQIESLYIAVEHQRRGVGKRLMKEMEEKAKEEGCTRMGVLASLPGVPFYKNIGYTAVEDSKPFDIRKQTFTAGDHSIETAVLVKDLVE